MPCRSLQNYPFWHSISAHSFELEAGKRVTPGSLLTGMSTCSDTKWAQMGTNNEDFLFFRVAALSPTSTPIAVPRLRPPARCVNMGKLARRAVNQEV